MAIAHGIVKTVAYKVQGALGTPASGAGGQLLRRRTGVGTLTKQMYESDEIVSHQQSTGGRHGLRSAAYKLAGILSPATYKDFFAALLRADFAVGATIAAGVDVTSAATSPHFVDASGGFLAAGLKVGDVGRWTGFTTTAAGNNSRNFLITALTASNMSGVFLDGTAVAAKVAGDSVTFTVVGKKTKAPLTGHTNKIFTIEDWYSDVSVSERFSDAKVSSIDIGLPASGNATCDINFVALDRNITGAQVLTTPTAETTTEILTAVQGVVYANGTAMGAVTGLQMSLAGDVTLDGPVVGSNNAPDSSRARITAKGSFTAFFESSALSTLFNDETVTTLIVVLTGDRTATSRFIAITLGRIKLSGDAPDDGEKGIVRTFPFTAELNSAGGAALAWDQTIVTVQDSDA